MASTHVHGSRVASLKVRVIVEVATKAAAGGLLVVAFALLAQTLAPKRLAGVFAAAPSVATASLAVTVASARAAEARLACAGMSAGAVGLLLYCMVAPQALTRLGALRGGVASLVVWVLGAVLAWPIALARAGGVAGVVGSQTWVRGHPARSRALSHTRSWTSNPETRSSGSLSAPLPLPWPAW